MTEEYKLDLYYEDIFMNVVYEHEPGCPPYIDQIHGDDPGEASSIRLVSVGLHTAQDDDKDLLEIGFLSEAVIRWIERQCYEDAQQRLAA